MSKRTTITLPDSVFEDLEQWAETEGRPTANLAAFLVETCVKQQFPEKTKVIERIINKGADNAARCVELASGAEHTPEELKATKKSEINPECPALANPSYVPY